MYDVLLLSLAAGTPSGSAGLCGTGDACCGGASARPDAEKSCASTPRVPVLSCADALTAAGARVELRTAHSDAEIDEVLSRLDGPPRDDGLTWPDPDGKVRLIVAVATDGQLRAIVRRLVRRYAPPPSRRPADLAANRTVPDLPPVGILPLDPTPSTGQRSASQPAPGQPAPGQPAPGQPAPGQPAAGQRAPGPRDLTAQLGLPRHPAEVAAAVLAGKTRRFDLLRTDAGSVTLDGALLGGTGDSGRLLAWRARVEVDDAVLTDGDEGILACALGNAGGYADLDGLPLLRHADPVDGVVEVAVAVPVLTTTRWRRRKLRIEVRRARGRAVAVTPRDTDVQFLDDGVAGTLTRKRSWWTEAGAWAAYVR